MDFIHTDQNPTSAMSDLNMSGLMLDFGPKHSTPVKEYSTKRLTSPSQPSLPDLQISALPHTWTHPANVGAEEPAAQPHAAQDPHTISRQLHDVSQKYSHTDTIKTADTNQSARNQPDKVAHQTVQESVVAQQRREINLLIRELHERDSELNELVISHQHQLSVWEQDRQLILRLQHKCQQLKAEVAKLKMEAGVQSSVERYSNEGQRPQTRIENLSDTFEQTNTAKAVTQTREQELNSVLQIRETELAEAKRTIEDLRARLKLADLHKQDSVSDSCSLDMWQKRCHTLKEDNDKLLGACVEKDRQLQQAMAQLQDTLQQALVLQQALAISCEREKRKEELLNSLRARQERSNLELAQLRNLYKRQNREMTMLQLTLDTSKESDPEHVDMGSRDSLVALNTPKGNTSTSSSRLPRPIQSVSSSYSHHHNSRPQHHHSLPTNILDSTKPSSPAQHAEIENGSGAATSIPDHGKPSSPALLVENKNRSEATLHVSYQSGHACVAPRSQTEMPVQGTASSRIEGSLVCTRDSRNVVDSIHSRADSSNSNNNCSNITSDAISPSSRQPEYTVHHPAALTTERTVSDQNVCDADDDGQKSHDVDTEAFWQKILSVRNGNENYTYSTKDLTQASGKQLLAEVQEDLAAQEPTDVWKNSQKIVINKRHLETQSESEKLPNGKHTASPTPSTMRCIGAQQIQAGQCKPSFQLLPHDLEGDGNTVNVVKLGAWHPSLGFMQSLLVDGRSPHHLPTAKCFPETWTQDGDKTYTPGEECVHESPVFDVPAGGWADQQLGNLRKQGVGAETHTPAAPEFLVGKNANDTPLDGAQQSVHGGVLGEAPVSSRSQFDEKLSSFLETPEQDASVDTSKSQGSSSPASKLHRLLLESQEMIKALEVGAMSDQY